MRIPLNCIVVSLWLWIRSKFRGYLWVRRSIHFSGLIPHSGVALRKSGKTVYIVEYIPPKNKLLTRENMLVLFDGTYRVWEMRAVSVKRLKSMVEVYDLTDSE